ncbi:hypothetical protein [Granulicella sp. L60]|uniref:hypothetical protein n=1 Tax=Granulicella sp. L60 TaxID=1641866 RepID=UPI00131BE3D1|nr:hypothetical protein [Granulicella sp. L60]
MNYWRMRMRKGNGGEDMFRQCVSKEIAAIHYTPVESVDLAQFSEDDVPEAWAELESAQSGSLRKFAWRIRGGDMIYVAESYPSRIVAVGRVRGSDRISAYRYWADTPIMDEDGHPWRHTVSVEWEQLFNPIAYPKPWATQATVLDLPHSEVMKIKSLLRHERKALQSTSNVSTNENDGAPRTEVDEEIQRRLIESTGYSRYSKEAIRVIDRKHAKLCNQFTEWLEMTQRIVCQVERRHIDVTFRLKQKTILVEFKIAYRLDPKPAIREALGQILEYNFYPDRKLFDHWILVLDCAPTHNDRVFLERLRDLNLPLSYGWLEEGSFRFSGDCPLFRPEYE